MLSNLQADVCLGQILLLCCNSETRKYGKHSLPRTRNHKKRKISLIYAAFSCKTQLFLQLDVQYFNIRMGSAHALEKRQLTQTYLSHNELEQLERSSNLVA